MQTFYLSETVLERLSIQRSDALLTSALFEFFFPLIWFNSIKNYFQWGRFDLHLPFYINEVSFCETKVAFYWKKEPFFRNNLTELFVNYFILDILLFFIFFVWNIFITYFAHMFYDMWYNDTYAKHANIGCENKKLNWGVMLLKNIYLCY